MTQCRALYPADDRRGAPSAAGSRDSTAGRELGRAAPEPAGWPANFWGSPKPHATGTSQRGILLAPTRGESQTHLPKSSFPGDSETR